MQDFKINKPSSPSSPSSSSPSSGSGELALPAKLQALLAAASERPEDIPQKYKDLGDGRYLVWTQFTPEPGKFYPLNQRRIQSTVILIETAESLLDRRSVPLLNQLGQWKKAAEGRFLVVYYPRVTIPNRLCGLRPEATRLPAKDLIVEVVGGYPPNPPVCADGA